MSDAEQPEDAFVELLHRSDTRDRLVVQLIAPADLPAARYADWPRIWARPEIGPWVLLDLNRSVRARQLAILLLDSPEGLSAGDAEGHLAGPSGAPTGGVGANARRRLAHALEQASAEDLFLTSDTGGRNTAPWVLLRATSDAQLALDASADSGLAVALTHEGRGVLCGLPKQPGRPALHVPLTKVVDGNVASDLGIPETFARSASRAAIAARSQGTGEPSGSRSDQPSAKRPRNVGRRRTGIAAVVVAVLLLAGWQATQRGPRYGRSIPVGVDNEVTAGANMHESSSPVRLTTKAIAFCDERGCSIAGTERRTGQQYGGAVCQRTGDLVTNGDDSRPDDDDNSRRFSSSRYLGVQLADGTFGYVSEVWLTARDRGGLGLPQCRQ